ncbi:glutamate--cysteine ligase regulatory subunit-like isoform X2 [Xenia sp. Carnegie-2017]|uniref:glutamate--cysteine ligase regulatory subunit-like isoform X2 n=1 Tax=Xenia sp. Carnegie-2017 TaxID=2897299 RepID=UPI001F039CF4|nr:glutamate--cysteine ligase regulatory subunit-like isoform X2 [Xenia sp. Carnegie-2017]
MNGCENNMENGNSKDHCVNGKIFQTAKEIYIHTGNLTNWSQSHSKVVKNTTEEICERIITTVNSSTSENDERYSKQECVRFMNPTLVEKVTSEERNTLKVSDLTELGIDYIDVVVLSIPPFLDAETQISVIGPMWRELEKLVEQSYVGDLAVCDFSMLALKQLCGFAKIKPSYDQINLASCCVMPQDLVAYAKEREFVF